MAVAKEVTWGQYFCVVASGMGRLKSTGCKMFSATLLAAIYSHFWYKWTRTFYLWKALVMCSGLPLTSVKLFPLKSLVNLACELCQSLIRSEIQSQSESWQYLCNSAWRLLSWGEPSKEEKFCMLRPKLVTFRHLIFFLQDLSINFNEAFF